MAGGGATFDGLVTLGGKFAMAGGRSAPFDALITLGGAAALLGWASAYGGTTAEGGLDREPAGGITHVGRDAITDAMTLGGRTALGGMTTLEGTATTEVPAPTGGGSMLGRAEGNAALFGIAVVIAAFGGANEGGRTALGAEGGPWITELMGLGLPVTTGGGGNIAEEPIPLLEPAGPFGGSTALGGRTVPEGRGGTEVTRAAGRAEFPIGPFEDGMAAGGPVREGLPNAALLGLPGAITPLGGITALGGTVAVAEGGKAAFGGAANALGIAPGGMVATGIFAEDRLAMTAVTIELDSDLTPAIAPAIAPR